MAKREKGHGKLSPRDFAAREKRFFHVVDDVFGLLRTAVRGAYVVLGIWIIGTALAPFAGHKTELNSVLNWMVQLKADRYFFALAATIAGGSWWQERRKRTKLIEEWGSYVRTLEKKIDPNRSSSGLLTTGKPRKEDADAL